MHVVLYTRADCCLCDEALATLQAHGLSAQLVDIDRQPEFRAAFDTCVPVVEIDGEIRFRGRVEPILLRRFLAAKARE